MKTKFFLSVFFTQLLISTLLLSNSVAQDFTKWSLPEGAKARLGKGTVSDVVYSPDRNSIAVVSSIGIWLYDAQTYQELSLFTGHTSYVYSVAFSPDGQTLASGSVDGTVLLWRTTSAITTDPQSVDAKGKHYTKWGALKTAEVYQNYPNPFNPETWIPYQLAKPADVTLQIYTVEGNAVRTLSLGHQTAGIYLNRSRAVHWDGKNEIGESVASGIYFYTLTAGDYTATRRMLILK